jgi:hypothetical protein
MPELTRRRDPNRANSWLIYYADVHVGTIARSVDNPGAVPLWKWSCGIDPGPGDQRGSTAATFAEARAAFKAAWQDYLPRCTNPDLQAWRDQQARAAEKYLGLDRDQKWRR